MNSVVRHRLRRYALIPGEGLGPLRFGSRIDLAAQLLGTPTESKMVATDYLELFFSDSLLLLFFDREDSFRLASIEAKTESPVSLFGLPLRKYLKERVEALVRERAGLYGFEAKASLDLETHWYEGSLTFPALAIDFHFEPGGKLDAVSWGPFVDANDRTFWPT